MPKVTANGVSLFYDLTGPPAAPVIVFSNSLGTTLEMWDDVVAILSRRYRCLRYDTRGHGRSEVIDAPITIEDLAEDLAGLLQALAIEKAHVVGLSIGGMTAQALALRDAERLKTLSLLATTAHLPSAQSWTERARLVRAEGTAAVVEATMGRWFTADFRAAAPDAVARVRKQFLTIEAAAYALCCEAIGAMDLRPAIGAISLPTLIISGAQDPSTPPAAGEDLRSRIADSQLVILSRAAHLLAVEQPAMVAAHLEGFIGLHEHAAAVSAPDNGLAAGLANRKAVLGIEHVERSLAGAGSFAAPWQEFITRVAWGEVWGDKTLPWKTRSLLTLAMMAALHREEEFKLHLRASRRNGVSVEELRALLMHAAVYAGVPAANAAFRWAGEVLGRDPNDDAAGRPS